jgi:hypothetical protein
MQGAEHCRFNDELFEIIVRATFREPGITFFSSQELSQQLGRRRQNGRVLVG